MSPIPAPGARPWRAYIDLTLAMVIVGSSVVAGKLMIAELPLHLASALRFACAAALIVPLLLVLEGVPRVSLRSLGIMLAQAACGGFLFNVLLLKGLATTSAGAAGIITSSTPAAMALIALVFLGERPSRRALLGVALSVAGVAAINVHAAGGGFSGTSLTGNLLVLGAVVAESLFLLLRKTVPEPLSPLAVSTLMTVFGFFLFLPGAVVEARGFNFAAVGAASWAVVAYYGLVVTVAAYLFWFSGLARVGAGTAGVFTAVMPVSAVALSALVLGEAVTMAHLAGAALVLSGIVCITLPRRAARRAPATNGSV